ncbi:ABC transporter ATP-binding protein [Melissococcus plutonius]|uniref:ABC transporter, ATP-binding protein n=1 Tax=Melissococcus plutonius (strain ATCC 35311 / DSM 29964 / CIP 104052 / LMG 20360 / NCIMB 702443) TaxID=940190 RepID=F3Y7U4_MELPT|nr:ABC transporter ATP-binding protein [Melissococcus plutonius]KMT30576.1 ABC transporter ATP-binding protein [Melissococcus plutonius]KMT35821.1 ABC transporter ATP-binding protein [Melissococcus plutonius]KMT40940.1 ABC transporter ATP-binding protein [Melissococcus plutonius]MBB5177740.1 ABC-2 type transport system ATP-binding protein [Melissococcus plutonius]BAK20572.1 ABC transporter, ATP-binding protein [Melissococcus plutonius ATCC 35311]
MNQVILEVENLSKSYKDKKILDHISFKIKKGEIIALLGVNGSGKSTLINILNQLIVKNEGTISLFGKRIIKESREKIGVMLQHDFSLNKIKVNELLRLVRSYYKTPLAYQTLLQLANLQEEENSYMTHLSGGQRRRLNFAIAMAGDPQLIFLDEPTAGMDSYSRKLFWQTIEEFKQAGKTFFVTSHYLEELDSISDHVLILKNTKLVYDGSLQELRQQKGNFIIKFTTKLPRAIFEDFSAVKKIWLNQDHYQLITEEPNILFADLNPYVKSLNELTVELSSLESFIYEINKETNK